MSHSAARAQMFTDAAKVCEGQTLTPDNAPLIIAALLEVGFNCGRDSIAGELQPLITRLEGVKFDPEDIILCSKN